MATTDPGQQRTAPTTSAVSAGLVVLLLGAGVLALVLVLGLVYLAGADGRTSVLDWLSNVLLLIVAGTSTGGLVQARRAKVQTNGSLDVRMRQAVEDVLRGRSDDGEG